MAETTQSTGAAGIDPLAVTAYFYPEDTPLRRMLWQHSLQVRDKALAILANPVCAPLALDAQVVAAGALLHDLGIGRCHAPKIGCDGPEPYIVHGLLGAAMLREYGRRHGLDLELYARICERHTGSGIAAEEVRRQNLPLPVRDYLPETPEEKLICLADKFFSKSGDMQEKPLSRVRHALSKFGPDALARFDALCNLFGI